MWVCSRCYNQNNKELHACQQCGQENQLRSVEELCKNSRRTNESKNKKISNEGTRRNVPSEYVLSPSPKINAFSHKPVTGIKVENVDQHTTGNVNSRNVGGNVTREHSFSSKVNAFSGEIVKEGILDDRSTLAYYNTPPGRRQGQQMVTRINDNVSDSGDNAPRQTQVPEYGFSSYNKPLVSAADSTVITGNLRASGIQQNNKDIHGDNEEKNAFVDSGFYETSVADDKNASTYQNIMSYERKGQQTVVSNDKLSGQIMASGYEKDHACNVNTNTNSTDKRSVMTKSTQRQTQECANEYGYNPVKMNLMTDSGFAAEIKRKEKVLVVTAIDFGTSFSGYAYSLCQEYRKDHSKINILTWNTGYSGCPCTYKTPTAILFDKDGKFHSFGYDAERNYAQMLEDKKHEGFKYFNKFKMQLYQAENMRRRRISHKTMLRDEQNQQMPALTVFSESIKYFKTHFLTCAKTGGLEDLRTDDIHWILTIPAIWKDDAKQFMREAATQAGIPNDFLSLVYEPEAAAIYCKELSILQNNSPDRKIGTFQNGHRFLVLDCGGGTVDITSYEIQADSSLCELESPSGGPWGGNAVNDEYNSLLQQLFGKDVLKTFEKEFAEDAFEFKVSFETKKKTVVSSSEEWITMRSPMSLIGTICDARHTNVKLGDVLRETIYSQFVIGERDKIRFKNNLLRECFVRPVTHIREHLRTLLGRNAAKSVKTIFMVGGFSECDILYSCIRNSFPNINVIRPTDPTLAIAKGAVMFGNNPCLIRERICPRTYGISVNEPFDPIRHKDNAHLKVIIEGQEKCTDIFKPIVKKGDPIVVGKSVFAIQCYPTRSTDVVATVEIYESHLKDPVYTVGENVRKLGVICLDIPDIERGKCRLITIQMHFGISELYVTVIESGTEKVKMAKFDCLSG